MKNLTLSILLSLSGLNAFALNKVVYGIDNRLELRNTPHADLKNSVAGMVKNYSLVNKSENKEDEGLLKALYSGDLTEYRGYRTCDDFRFREQATLPSCTGFLIAEDLLVTAGHCVLNYNQKVKDTPTASCMQNSWVFGYEDTSETEEGIVLKKDDVYKCATVVDASYTMDADYAIVKLDRKTVNKTPVKLSDDAANYKKDASVFVVGHPTGLPLKIAMGARVKREVSDNQFLTNLDTFAGNSGSPIFNSKKEVVGILVSGEKDYYYDSVEGCVRPNVCDDVDGICNTMSRLTATGETGTKIKLVTKVLSDMKKKEAEAEKVSEVNSDVSSAVESEIQ